MKHIKTFESFLNEVDSKDPKLVKGADITIEMDDEDGDFSAGDYRVTGLTRGGVILDGMGKRNLQVSFGALNDAGYTVNESELNEKTKETGLMFTPRGTADATKMQKALDKSDLYGEWNARENYFFFPEETEHYDNLEMELQKLVDDNDINGYFEGIW